MGSRFGYTRRIYYSAHAAVVAGVDEVDASLVMRKCLTIAHADRRADDSKASENAVHASVKYITKIKR